VPAQTRGFVYAATGASYTTLARRAARNLRAVMPKAQIDLFTDQDIADPVFDLIHRLDHSWFRPKMEALLRSRFGRTVLMDADTIVLRDVGDLFGAVNRCDLAACISTGRPRAMYRGQPDIPRVFPYLNTGVMVIRRSRRMLALIREWEFMMRKGDLPKDQPPLRWLLYHRRVPFLVLPLEYNLVHIPLLDRWEPHFGAPRILHVQALHDVPPGEPGQPFDLVQVLGKERAAEVALRLRIDRQRSRADAPAPSDVTGHLASRMQRVGFHLGDTGGALRRLLTRTGRRRNGPPSAPRG
jgi:hypothetical protein